MQRIYFVLLVSLSLSGCISTERFSEIVKDKYKNESTQIPVMQTDWYSINTDSLKLQDSLVSVKVLKKNCIPAIVYIHSENTLRCDLNPEIPLKRLEKKLVAYSDSIGIKSKLNGRKLELTVLQVPHTFIYSHIETTLFLVVGSIGTFIEEIHPINNELRVLYKITLNGEVSKSGIITLKNSVFYPLKRKGFQSRKDFIWEYLNQYRDTCNRMFRQLCYDLNKELL